MHSTRHKYKVSGDHFLFTENELRRSKMELLAQNHKAAHSDVINNALGEALDHVDTFIKRVVYDMTDLEELGIPIEEMMFAGNEYPNLAIRKKIDNAYELFESLRPEYCTLFDHVEYLNRGISINSKNNFITKLKVST